MTLRQVSWVLGFAVMIGSNWTLARGAEIQTSDSNFCAFKLDGDIVPGDRDRLATVASVSHLDPLNERTTTLCLRSRGGSADEGLKIAEWIFSHGISTLVPDGSYCYSACAIIFMAGVLPDREVPYRKLSAGGLLGFHAPYLSVAEGSYSKNEIEDAANSMRLAILGLLRMSAHHTAMAGNDFIRKSLVVELLEKGPQEVVFVNSIAKAAQWDIDIYDYGQQYPKPDKADALVDLCNNFHYANIDEPAPANPPELSLKVDKYASKFEKNDFRVLVLNQKTHDTVCEIYPSVEHRHPDKVHFSACSYDYWTEKTFGDCREYKTAPRFRVGNYVPGFFTLPPGTLLKKVTKQ